MLAATAAVPDAEPAAIRCCLMIAEAGLQAHALGQDRLGSRAEQPAGARQAAVHKASHGSRTTLAVSGRAKVQQQRQLTCRKQAAW